MYPTSREKSCALAEDSTHDFSLITLSICRNTWPLISQ